MILVTKHGVSSVKSFDGSKTPKQQRTRNRFHRNRRRVVQLATNANRFETSFRWNTGRKRRQIEFLAPLDLDDDFDQDYLDLMESVTEMTDQEFRSLGFPGLATNKKQQFLSLYLCIVYKAKGSSRCLMGKYAVIVEIQTIRT